VTLGGCLACTESARVDRAGRVAHRPVARSVAECLVRSVIRSGFAAPLSCPSSGAAARCPRPMLPPAVMRFAEAALIAIELSVSRSSVRLYLFSTLSSTASMPFSPVNFGLAVNWSVSAPVAGLLAADRIGPGAPARCSTSEVGLLRVSSPPLPSVGSPSRAFRMRSSSVHISFRVSQPITSAPYTSLSTPAFKP